jgi:hypothetical protein
MNGSIYRAFVDEIRKIGQDPGLPTHEAEKYKMKMKWWGKEAPVVTGAKAPGQQGASSAS